MFFYSQIEPLYFILPLIGLVIGLFGTILGGGGGFFFLPVLTLILGVDAQIAVITSLVATLPVCIVGVLSHHRKGHVSFKTGLLFSIAGIAGAFSGTGIAVIMSSSQLKSAFGIYSVFIALIIILTTVRKNDKTDEGSCNVKDFNHTVVKRVKGFFFGFGAGVITGAFGTSGTAPVLAGLFSMRIMFKLVVGTSLFVVLINTCFAVGAHFLLGKIDLTLVWFLTAGSALGAFLGPRLLAGYKKADSSENSVRYIYALAMVILGVLMITN
ncbi:sulfite exporter TauE/SafE family protein [Marinilabiliaceae bacterium ANBcel2]|nr:sulfite exporter TauE/SafE family protein [Marinilabiliaceae bacterium ANBcel2]